jgi:RNA polymerase sigma-70 factor (ECF subfamily)
MVTVGGEPNDEALAARAASGDDHAFETLVVRYQARIYRLACRMTSETDAPDILQETFLQAYRHLPSFRGDSKFGSWVYRIATNAALMHRRARARRPAESLDTFLPQFDGHGVHAPPPEQLRVAAEIERRLDERLLAERARAFLDRLPDLYREAFVLRDLEELPTTEVAAILGLEPAAVRQRVHRARLMLRGYLNGLVEVTT